MSLFRIFNPDLSVVELDKIPSTNAGRLAKGIQPGHAMYRTTPSKYGNTPVGWYYADFAPMLLSDVRPEYRALNLLFSKEIS